jgi:hypothetical protein
MEPLILTDKALKPNDEIVFSIIGDNSIFWQEIMKYPYDNYKDISQQWNFYNDGKCWLLRTQKKKKTLFWVGVQKDTFRVSFWFGEKAEGIILESDLPESIKTDYRNAKRYKIGRGISVVVGNAEDVENVIKLIEIKAKLK